MSYDMIKDTAKSVATTSYINTSNFVNSWIALSKNAQAEKRINHLFKNRIKRRPKKVRKTLSSQLCYNPMLPRHFIFLLCRQANFILVETFSLLRRRLFFLLWESRQAFSQVRRLRFLPCRRQEAKGVSGKVNHPLPAGQSS